GTGRWGPVGWARASPSCTRRRSGGCWSSSSSSRPGSRRDDRSPHEPGAQEPGRPGGNVTVDNEAGTEQAPEASDAVFSGRHDRRKVTDWAYEEVRRAIIDLKLK